MYSDKNDAGLFNGPVYKCKKRSLEDVKQTEYRWYVVKVLHNNCYYSRSKEQRIKVMLD